jgi:hypothetical protein
VDSTNVVSEDARGRRSTWLTSQIEFKYGILIGDFAHMPASDCGTWPAFWTIAEGHDVPQGEDVPYGEFDIVEYANGDSNGAMTLHSPGQTCTFNQSQALQSSRRQGDASDCGADPGGCSTFGAEGSVGTPFNEQGGGVYAMDWTKQHINIFYFPRKEIPQDIADGNPDPKSWGKPVASFDEGDGDCDLDAVFYPQTIVSFVSSLLAFWVLTRFDSILILLSVEQWLVEKDGQMRQLARRRLESLLARSMLGIIPRHLLRLIG